MTKQLSDTQPFIMQVGRHAGTPITRVPVSYLLWIVNSNGPHVAQAQDELERRGTVVPALDISGHAVDRASQQLLHIWQKYHQHNEGLHAWLVRMAGEALHQGRPDPANAERISYMGVVFVFEFCDKWPVLKTIIRRKKG